MGAQKDRLVNPLPSDSMTSTAVLTQADSLATWLGVAGQWVGALGTFAAVLVALRLARWERRRDTAEQRDREAAQARLVTTKVGYPSETAAYPDDLDIELPMVQIINYSELPVYRPRIESMGDAPPPVRWGINPNTGEDYSIDVLPPNQRRSVPFEHVDPHSQSAYTTVTAGKIKKRVDADDVTITFIDTYGLRWRRTGNGEPIRVAQPTP